MFCLKGAGYYGCRMLDPGGMIPTRNQGGLSPVLAVHGIEVQLGAREALKVVAGMDD
jgi:hypothetical protein